MLRTAHEVLRFRGLIATLVGRELKARYRGSVLGFFWSLANPLLLTLVYTFVFGFVFSPPRASLAQPYALFLISGLFPWIWVSTSLIEGTLSLLANAGLIRKSVFPAEILPVVSVISNLVHFVLALPVMSGALLVGRWLGHPVGGWTALLLPVVIAVQWIQVTGLVLGLSALNAHFKDDRLFHHRDIHLGLAVARDEGLVVPVIRDAGRLTLAELAADIERFAEAARRDEIRPESLTGSTFTLTNSGTYGSLFFTPIVNVPEVAILGMGRVADAPVVRAGAVEVGKLMYLSLSYDHRAVDGSDAVSFIADVKRRLEAMDETDA